LGTKYVGQSHGRNNQEIEDIDLTQKSDCSKFLIISPKSSQKPNVLGGIVKKSSLRFYRSAKGDCIAVRTNDQTRLIFDTGESGKTNFCKGKDRQKSIGFGKALFDAGNSCPIVVISHVDRDHIGGLQAWVDELLKEKMNWKTAREMARKEIKEVWCNIPTTALALSQLANISFLAENVDLVEEYQQADIDQWLRDLKSSSDPQNAEFDDPFIVFDNFSKLEEAAKFIFGEGADDGDRIDQELKNDQAKNMDEVVRLYGWLKTVVSMAYPDINEQFSDRLFSIRDNASVEFSEVAVENNIGFLDINLIFDKAPQESEADISFEFVFRSENPEKESTVTVKRSYKVNLPMFDNLYQIPTLSFKTIPLNLLLNRGSTSNKYDLIPDFLTEIENCGSIQDSVRYILGLIRKFAYQQGGELIDKVAVLDAYFGLSNATELKDHVSLFYALGKLGIPVIGTGAKHKSDNEKLLFVDNNTGKNKINQLGIRLLAPTQKNLDSFLANWEKYKKRLTTEIPKNVNFCCKVMYSLLDLSSYTYDSDTSKKNLSSISLWLENSRAGWLVLFTGDGIYEEVMVEARNICAPLPADPPLPSPKNVYIQIPHHGGIHNTDLKAQDKAPWKVFSRAKKIVAFVSGGEDQISNVAGSQGPRKLILDFFSQENEGDQKEMNGVTCLIFPANPIMSKNKIDTKSGVTSTNDENSVEVFLDDSPSIEGVPTSYKELLEYLGVKE
jgi:ribonuclease BN (tRNA processing enzyme)